MWPSKALGRHCKRPNEGLYLDAFLKGRKVRGLGGKGEFSGWVQKAITAWGSEQGVTSVQ